MLYFLFVSLHITRTNCLILYLHHISDYLRRSFPSQVHLTYFLSVFIPVDVQDSSRRRSALTAFCGELFVPSQSRKAKTAGSIEDKKGERRRSEDQKNVETEKIILWNTLNLSTKLELLHPHRYFWSSTFISWRRVHLSELTLRFS